MKSNFNRHGFRAVQLPLYVLLLLYSFVGFTFLMALYASYSSNRVSARLGFAVTMSLAPAFLALALYAFIPWMKGRNVAITYAALFFLIQVLWAMVHG